MPHSRVCVQPAPRSPTHSRDGFTRGLRGAWEDASRLVSTLSHEVDWPWSGSVRKHVYMDFVVYVMLLVVFCCITLLPTTKRSSDSFNLVQSIQSTLVKEVWFLVTCSNAVCALYQALAQPYGVYSGMFIVLEHL